MLFRNVSSLDEGDSQCELLFDFARIMIRTFSRYIPFYVVINKQFIWHRGTCPSVASSGVVPLESHCNL